MFLVNTRSDIQFSVHQYSRFTHSPKKSHTLASKRVIRHLKHTQENGKDRGLTFELEGNAIPKTECHADADFAGLWNVENNKDPVSSKTRPGLVIFVGKLPSHVAVQTARRISPFNNRSRNCGSEHEQERITVVEKNGG